MNSHEILKFSRDWVRAWNQHNIDEIMNHYQDDFILSSPAIVQLFGEQSGVLQGKSNIKPYWEKALELYPDLNFEIDSVLLGVDIVTINYMGVTGRTAESFWFGTTGKVSKSVVQYEVNEIGNNSTNKELK